jgi:succinate dehydrogenase / fumarate reductase flavoprotein subunit
MMIDVLIIGSGIAGLTAALNAKKNNSNVLVISKTYPTHSQSVQAQGGINAVLYENDDSVETHIEDTYKGSCKLANKDNIKFMCENAKDTIYWLDSIGVPFNRTSVNKIAQRKFGGTKKIRTCYSSDYTGLKILHTLYDKCINENIKFENEHMLLNLIIENNQCYGATFLDIKTGVVKEYKSKTVILATGGYAGIYNNHTTNSYSNSGDGIAVAFNAGAKLSNIEFVQFHPTTLENSNVLISESARGEGGYLLDKEMNRFIDELKSRDEVSRAIYEKIQRDEKVYLDLRHLGIDKIKESMPQERSLAINYSNIKIEDEILPITPASHYSMGGIKTDINAKTSIKNLFACGECAEASIHGANRLGGNSLLEIVTFGKVAGLNASNEAKEIKYNEFSSIQIDKDKKELDEIFEIENKINFYSEKERVGDLLFNNLGLFRTESQMQMALTELKKIKENLKYMGIDDKSKIYNKNLIDLLEFKNMIEVSIHVCICALNRKESRGSHFRLDYPNQDINYEKNSFVIKENTKIKVDFEDVQ